MRCAGMSAALLVGLAVIGLLAFTTEGTIGFGGTVIAASLRAQLVPLPELLPAFIPVNVVMSAYLVATAWRHIAWRLLLTEVLPPVGVGLAVGIAVFRVAPQAVLQLGFAAFVIVLAAAELRRCLRAATAVEPGARVDPAPMPTALRRILLGVGGVAHGLFGTGGPMVVYVLRRQIADKTVFRGTLAILWITLNAALLTSFALGDRFTADTPVRLAVLASTMVPGLVLGNRLHRALEPARFERVVWTGLLLSGSILLVKSAMALPG